MKLIYTTSAIMAATASLCVGYAMPNTDDMSSRQAPQLTPQLIMSASNASYLLGWEIAGLVDTKEHLEQHCANIVSEAGGQWGQIGLPAQLVQEPICEYVNSFPSTDPVTEAINKYNTNIFITQLLYSFPTSSGSAPFRYLCQSLDSRRLGSFQVSDITARNAICAAGQTSPPPASFAGTAAPASAVTDFVNIVSALLAFEVADAATTTDQLAGLCKDADAYSSRLAPGGPNISVVKSTLCGIKTPLSAQDASAAIQKYSTCAFTTILLNASGVNGWKKWFCTELDVAAMNAVGLDGQFVKDQVCSP